MIYKLMSIIMMVLLTACGMKGNLVRPADIPAYEKTLEKKDGSLPL